MTRAGIRLVTILFLALGTVSALQAAEQGKPISAPDFQEVYDLIRAHLAGTSEADLNRTAVDALVRALGPSVTLVGDSEKEPIEMAGGPLIKKSSLFEGPIAYLHPGRVEEGLPEALRQAYEHIGTNRVNGVVLDLRFTDGADYAAAAATADMFVAKEKPLLNWGKGVVISKEKDHAISVPVAVLVNRETARAAEALAAALREAGVALIIGGRTAGQAMIAQEYPLKNGQKLRIATTPIQVGQGVALSAQGVKPDLSVNVSLEDERAYLRDAFTQLRNSFSNTLAAASADASGSATNRVRRPRFNEAELVRERRDGLGPDLELSGRGEGEAEKPVVRDPALARALDLLKGLAVVRPVRS